MRLDDRAGILTEIFTPDDAPEVLAHYADAGFVGLLRKPMTGADLRAALEQAVTARDRMS